MGRENAGVRLSNEHIVNAVLGFSHPSPRHAGHASLILGGLMPVGGPNASYKKANSFQNAVLALLDTNGDGLARLTISVEHDHNAEEYTARLYLREGDKSRTVSFVSKYATSLLQAGAESSYQHDCLEKMYAIEKSYGRTFFRELARAVAISRQLNRPFETDWREYETEEERARFHKELGSRANSDFLNLRVDAHVMWPNKPTRMKFGGHHFVLFPSTKDHSQSISIDLRNEKITADDARSLMNRLLSIMSWCDDQPSSLHDGWSGNPIPSPVLKPNGGHGAASQWYFFRSVPDSEDLLRCLAFYRDGLNAYAVGLSSHAVLSFFRVFETRFDSGPKVAKWVNAVLPQISLCVQSDALQAFEADRQKEKADPGTYVYRNCRVAAAHAARDLPSDPDATIEARRLFNASKVIQALARYFITQEFQFSSSYLYDQFVQHPSSEPELTTGEANAKP